ncbi:DgyrCDS2426 [Dimorphilus gyrociliatus]|uniref:DgyrCDS2426 n=1 Tax=Dimorphilus gyrociliatus TaxID=2664684 RepID=A0A7I8VBL1_9ANNE|nr:DgyrCDS2426 [Dimorphilus gyrociliatus]
MDHNHQCSAQYSSSVQQSIAEMEFERGIWEPAVSGDYNEVKKFISKGVDVNRPDQSGYTALHYASRNGHEDVCSLLLKHGAFVNATTRSGNSTSLHRASSTGKKSIVELLIKNTAEIKAIDSDGKTALHKAAENQHKDIIDYLLSVCPELKDVKDNKGKSFDYYLKS